MIASAGRDAAFLQGRRFTRVLVRLQEENGGEIRMLITMRRAPKTLDRQGSLASSDA